MDETPDIAPEIATRRQSYVDSYAIQTEGLIGWGLDGIVWRTSRATALKIHGSQSRYRRERDVYLRLRLRSLRRLAGFYIPVLIEYDDSCLALELGNISLRP